MLRQLVTDMVAVYLDWLKKQKQLQDFASGYVVVQLVHFVTRNAHLQQNICQVYFKLQLCIK